MGKVLKKAKAEAKAKEKGFLFMADDGKSSAKVP